MLESVFLSLSGAPPLLNHIFYAFGKGGVGNFPKKE
jgi:hypothetical protein